MLWCSPLTVYHSRFRLNSSRSLGIAFVMKLVGSWQTFRGYWASSGGFNAVVVTRSLFRLYQFASTDMIRSSTANGCVIAIYICTVVIVLVFILQSQFTHLFLLVTPGPSYTHRRLNFVKIYVFREDSLSRVYHNDPVTAITCTVVRAKLSVLEQFGTFLFFLSVQLSCIPGYRKPRNSEYYPRQRFVRGLLPPRRGWRWAIIKSHRIFECFVLIIWCQTGRPEHRPERFHWSEVHPFSLSMTFWIIGCAHRKRNFPLSRGFFKLTYSPPLSLWIPSHLQTTVPLCPSFEAMTMFPKFLFCRSPFSGLLQILPGSLASRRLLLTGLKRTHF